MNKKKFLQLIYEANESDISRPYLTDRDKDFKPFEKLLKRERIIRNSHGWTMDEIEKEEALIQLKNAYYLDLLKAGYEYGNAQNLLVCAIVNSMRDIDAELLQAELNLLNDANAAYSNSLSGITKGRQ